jgi:Domain of unknown function (DUF5666)
VKGRNRLFLVLAILSSLGVGAAAQDAPSGTAPGGTGGRPQRGSESGPRPVLGKITAIDKGMMEITGPDGQTVQVKYTEQTEFRKDREPAKASDFKVGDMVAVRGGPGTDHTITATMIASRTGGPGGGGVMMMGGQGGTLGKDYIIGEVKSIDPPRLTVLRTDNVTETLELNEETSLRKGRESITMADIQVGDHLISRGELQKDVFVPKGVMVLGPEQWKRFQEFQAQTGGASKPAATDSAAPPKPQE